MPAGTSFGSLWSPWRLWQHWLLGPEGPAGDLPTAVPLAFLLGVPEGSAGSRGGQSGP